MTIATAVEPQTHPLQCMEIWGGNEGIDDAISVAGIDAWIYSQPFAGQRRGGDIHYISTCGHGRIARFMVADVSGHGASVGALGARLRRLMRRNINKLDQTRFVRALNKGFESMSTGGLFATALLTSYHAPSDHLVVCNAGHPPPLWYRARLGAWSWLAQDIAGRAARLHNLPLGIVEPTEYHQFAVPLEVGDLVLIYTDWLPEAADPSGRQLGPDGVLDLVQRLDAGDPAHFCRRLTEAVAAYRGGAPADDDVTVVLLHHNAADPPPLSAGDYLRVLGKVFRLMKV